MQPPQYQQQPPVYAQPPPSYQQAYGQQPQYGQPQYGGQPQYAQPGGYAQPTYAPPAATYGGPAFAPPAAQSYKDDAQYGDASNIVPKDGGRGSSSGSGAEAALSTGAHRGWRDLPWAIAFWLHVIALLVVGFICYRKWKDNFDGHTTTTGPNGTGTRTTTSESGDGSIGPLDHGIPLIGFGIIFGAGMAALALWLCKNHGVVMIWISLVWTLVISGAMVVLAAFAGNLAGIIIGAIIFALTAWYVYSVRHKVPFAAAMLDVALRAMGMFWTTWTIPILGMIFMAGLSYLWSLCAFSIVYAVDNGSSEGARSARGFIFFLLVLSFFWTMLTVKGWVHTCIAGVQATWYFMVPHATPKHPVFGAIKRASTTSFGSIAFGSFIVAFIRTLRFFVQMAMQQARNSNNQLAACALCILECIIGCIEGIINYINQYAFAIVAIYGTPFLESANRAWGLMRGRGFDAVVNDSLIGGVLSLLTLLGGLTTGVFTALLAYYAYDVDWRPFAGVGFVIGLCFMLVASEVIESAVIALFICLADDPVTLQRTKPEEYHRVTDPLNVYYPNRGAAAAQAGMI